MPEDLGREAAVILETGRRICNIHLRFYNRLATITRFQFSEPVCFLSNPFRKLEQQSAALLSSGLWPRSAFEGFTGSSCGTLHICFSGIRHLSDNVLRRGIVYRKPRPSR